MFCYLPYSIHRQQQVRLQLGSTHYYQQANDKEVSVCKTLILSDASVLSLNSPYFCLEKCHQNNFFKITKANNTIESNNIGDTLPVSRCTCMDNCVQNKRCHFHVEIQY